MPPNYLIPICRRATPSSILFPSARHFQTSSSTRLPRKDSQDRNSINTEATEYSKSGTDDAAAKQDDAAYDPNVTDPEKEKDVAGAGNEVLIFFPSLYDGCRFGSRIGNGIPANLI